MRSRLLLTSIMIVVLLTGCSSPIKFESEVQSGYRFEKHIAIVDVIGEVPGEKAKNQIADLFTMQLISKQFSPIERERVMFQMKDEGINQGDMSLQAYAIEAGRVLGVNAVMIVKVTAQGRENSLTAKILETEHGSPLWMGNGTTGQDHPKWEGNADAFTEAESSTTDLFQNHAMRRSTEPTPLMTMATDVPLTPSEIAPFKQIVETICKNIPQPYEVQQQQPVKDKKFKIF